MFQKLEIFRMAHQMAVHAGQRQAIIASNIANADTPGYRARDITPFAQTYAKAPDQGALRQTRQGHMPATSHGTPPRISMAEATAISPNGNSVSLEAEMVKSVEAGRQHTRALSIYRNALTVLRSSLGR